MISGYVRLGTQDLDFEIPILDCSIEREYRSQGGFQLRNPNPDFLDFHFTVRLGNRKEDCKTTIVNSGLLFAANYACACKTAVLKDRFSNPFSNSKMEMQKRICQR